MSQTARGTFHICVIEAHKEIDECGFSTPGLTDYCDDLPGLRVETASMRYLAFGIVAEMHIVCLHITLYIFQSDSIRSVGFFCRRIDKVEHTFEVSPP